MSTEFDAGYDAGLGACRAELARLRAENAELRTDAERYRWLRREKCPFSVFDVWTGYEDVNYLWEDELDAAIDAARKEEQK